jgi:hypothetical protein
MTDWETEFRQGAQEGRFADAVALFVNAYRGVTYVELQNRLLPYMETKGDFVPGLDGKNIVFWSGVSKELHEAIREAIVSGRIHAAPTVPLTYMIDGRMLDLPIAKRPPKSGYKQTRWLPVVFNPGEHEGGPAATTDLADAPAKTRGVGA